MSLETGATCGICTKTWSEELIRIPSLIVALLENIPRFRSAEDPLPALCSACLNAKITDLE